MGATGAVLTCKALDFLRDQNKQYGLVTMCIGGGCDYAEFPSAEKEEIASIDGYLFFLMFVED